MALLCEDLSELYSHFNEFRVDGKFCDVVIKVGEQSFHCHRIVLASALKYFRTMFSGNFSEGEKNEIELKGIDAGDFEILLTHVYGKRINFKEDNMYRLLRIGHYLGPESFETKIINYIVDSNSIPLETALSIFMFACETEKIVLVDKLVPYMANNFVTICKYVTFHRINGKYLLQIMSHPQLDKDPTAILDFLGQWIKCVGKVNAKFLPDILTTINLSEIPLDWILKTLSSCQTHKDTGHGEGSIEESSNVEDVNKVEDLEQYSFGIDAAGEFGGKVRENFLPFQVFTLDLLSADEPNTHKINTYEIINRDNEQDVQFLETNEDWSVPQNFQKVHCKSVFVEKLCYTIFCADIWTETYQSYSSYSYQNICTASQTYTFTPSVNYNSPKKLKTYQLQNITNLENVAVAVHGTYIYLYNDVAFALYNTERDEWISIPSNTNFIKTQSPNLISYKRSLYLIGGKHPSGAASNTQVDPTANTLSLSQANGKSFQQFDPREGKWLQKPMMNYAHYKSASCIYNDKLYVSGGDDLAFFKGYVEYFDFIADKWNVSYITMPEPKMNHILRAYDDKLWFFGGETYSQKSVQNICSWYAYDMKEQHWTDIFSMPKSYGKFKTQQILDVVINV